MKNEAPASDEVDITEAMQLTGKSRDALMRWKRSNRVRARVVEQEYTQRQRRILFNRDDLLKLAGRDM